MRKLFRLFAPATVVAAVALAALVAGCGGSKTASETPDADIQTRATAPATAPDSPRPQPPSAGRKPAADAPGAPVPPAKAPAGKGAPPPPKPIARPAAKVDIPVYPGAKPFTGKGAEASRPEVKEYATSAGFSEVVKWYRRNFKAQEAPVPAEARGKMAAFRSINEKTGEVRIVNIVNPGKGARIALAQMTVPKDMASKLKQDRGGPPELPKDVKVVRDKDKAAEQIGLPIYPKATVRDGVLMSRSKVPDLRQVALQMTSEDSPKQVAEWYRSQLKGEKLQEQKSDKEAYAMGYADSSERAQYWILTGKRGDSTVIQLMKRTFPASPGGSNGKANP